MEAGREIPEGHAVIHRDGDEANCELDNLECVPRRVLAVLNSGATPPYAGPEANPARIRLAELKSALAERKRA